MTELVAQAFDLTLFGMGFVFLFLILLVGITKLMSIIVQKSTLSMPSAKSDNTFNSVDEIDEEAKFIIKQAIKLHRGA